MGKDTSIITAILLGQAYPEIMASSSSLTLMPCALFGGVVSFFPLGLAGTYLELGEP